METRAREGDLYKILNVCGMTFPLYYGYYDDRDRHSKFNDPIPIYPDFLEAPQYTAEGIPFVTAMQDACEHYAGHDREGSCESCLHYHECEDLIGICRCDKRKTGAGGADHRMQI